MTKEVDIQANLVSAFNRAGGFAFKAANQFLVGVADLSVKLPGVEHAYCEVKLVAKPLKSATVQNGLTDKQKKFLRDYRKAGGVGIYAILMKDKARWRVYLGSDIALDKIPVVSFDLLPRWTEPKQIAAMFEAFIQRTMNERGRKI